MLFEDLNLIAPLLSALKKTGYTEPTPIQAQSIPIVLERKDLLACAQTGTGKTAAFSLPIIQLLETEKQENNDKRRKIRALIITPTRELAIQIYDQISIYGKECNLRHTVIFGGVGQQPQVQNLKNGVDILVATKAMTSYVDAVVAAVLSQSTLTVNSITVSSMLTMANSGSIYRYASASLTLKAPSIRLTNALNEQ